MRPWITVEGVYVAAPSKNKDAAYEFAKYLTDVAAGEGPGARGTADAREQGGLLGPEGRRAIRARRAFRKQVEVAVPMPNLPEMTMVWSPGDHRDEHRHEENGHPQGRRWTRPRRRSGKAIAELRKK